jgi:nicotinamide-nucleotide amidase
MFFSEEKNQKTFISFGVDMLESDTLAKAEKLLQICRERGLRLATAESCTGGLIAAALTHIAGSSDVFERGFVTYSNEAKTEMLGVPADMIQHHGAVSAEVAGSMAEGALAHSPADLAVSVTGVAGPGGGSVEKPVGLVWFGCAQRDHGCTTFKQSFAGDRTSVRAQSVAFALKLLADALDS